MRWGRHRSPGTGSWEHDDRVRKAKDRAALAGDLEMELYASRWRPRRGRRHKDRVRWCKGHVGREHELTVKVVREARSTTYEHCCRNCGRVFDRYYTIFVTTKPEWFLAWERAQGRSRPR